jgi:peptidoglycan/xylan/chitin deacetylase (PgdA/CDA1 family)
MGVAACSTSGDGGAAGASEGAGPGRTSATSGIPAAPGTSPAAARPSATTPAGSSGTPAQRQDAVLTAAGPDIRFGPRDAPAVALTFHGAGAAARTSAVLDIARAHDAHVTVFAVGQWLQANPALGKAILAAGHDLGNHTWSHRPMRRLTAAQARDEVGRGAAEVAAVRGSAGLLFRPSGTPTSTAVIRAAASASGYARCISYDVDPQDYLDPGAGAVQARTLAAVRAGSIVSLHLGHQGTVAALPGILAGLRARGLRAVTITELLA